MLLNMNDVRNFGEIVPILDVFPLLNHGLFLNLVERD